MMSGWSDRRGWAFGAVLCLGCYSSATTGEGGDADAGTDTAADVSTDGATDSRVDGGSCGAPQHWVRTTLEIQRLENASDGEVIVGQTARVLAWVNVGPPGCIELGRILVEAGSGDRVAAVVVEGWRNEDALAGPCAPPEPTAVFVALPDLAVGVWTVRDGSAGPAGDPASTTLEILPCETTCGCLGPERYVREGFECRWDCECEFGLWCVGHYTIAGATERACQRTCNDADECEPRQSCVSWDDGPSAVCETRSEDLCESSDDCGPGHVCDCGDGEGVRCYCAPGMPADGVPCCRGDDCVPGQDCVLDDPGVPPFCAVRCTGDAGCPSSSFCAGPGTPLSGLCLSYE